MSLKRLQDSSKEEKFERVFCSHGLFFRKWLSDKGLCIMDIIKDSENLLDEMKKYYKDVEIDINQYDCDVDEISEEELELLHTRTYNIVFENVKGGVVA